MFELAQILGLFWGVWGAKTAEILSGKDHSMFITMNLFTSVMFYVVPIMFDPGHFSTYLGGAQGPHAAEVPSQTSISVNDEYVPTGSCP